MAEYSRGSKNPNWSLAQLSYLPPVITRYIWTPPSSLMACINQFRSMFLFRATRQWIIYFFSSIQEKRKGLDILRVQEICCTQGELSPVMRQICTGFHRFNRTHACVIVTTAGSSCVWLPSLLPPNPTVCACDIKHMGPLIEKAVVEFYLKLHPSKILLSEAAGVNSG